MMRERTVSKALLKKRLHSLMGILLTFYLMMHLFVNSQAALFFGEDGQAFIRAVNSIHELPYLPIFEFLLALPFVIHGFFGFFYLFSGRFNSFPSDGTTPALPMYERNKAYTWQRITAYLLIVGILAHVVHMRFINHPIEIKIDEKEHYVVQVGKDRGLTQIANRLEVNLEDKSNQEISKHFDLKKGEVIAVAKNFGTAELLMVREVFKDPLMMFLYTLFVVFACFHAFNGLWTFLISQGIIINEKSRAIFLKISYGLMLLFIFLGLVTIYATYWINLKN